MNPDSSLETFAPVARIVTLQSGEKVEILPLRLGQLPAFQRAVRDIAGLLAMADYITLLEQHPQAAIDTLLAAGLPPGAVEGLGQDDAVDLLAAIYEVNGDFFIRRLRPAMTRATTGALAQIAKLKDLAGAAPSPGSSSTDTTSGPASH